MESKSKPSVPKRLYGVIAFAIVLYTALQHLDVIRHAIGTVFSVIAPVLYGFILAYVLNLIMRPVEKLFSFMDRWPKLHRIKRLLSIILSLVIVAVILAVIVLIAYPQVEDAAKTLINSLPDYFAKFSVWATNALQQLQLSEDTIYEINLDWQYITGQIMKYLEDSSDDFFQMAASITGSLATVVIYIFVAFFTALHTLASKEKCYAMYHAIARRFLPEKVCQNLFHVVEVANHAFSHYLSGQVLEALLYGVLVFIGMLIFGFPYPPVIAVILIFTALIPVAGPWIGTILSALLVFIVSPTQALWFLIFILVLQQIENNLIYPKVVGQHIGLPDLLVLVAVVIGSSFGILGIILSVPLFAIVYTLLKEAIANGRSKQDSNITP